MLKEVSELRLAAACVCWLTAWFYPGHNARKVRSPSAPMGDQERMLQQLLDQGASAGFSLK